MGEVLVFKCAGHLIKHLICALYHIGKDHPSRQVVEAYIAEYAEWPRVLPRTAPEYFIQYKAAGKLYRKDPYGHYKDTQQKMKALQVVMPKRKDDRAGTIDKDHPHIGMAREAPVRSAMLGDSIEQVGKGRKEYLRTETE